MKTQVFGFGHPLRGDDGIGIRVAEALPERHPQVSAAAFRAFDLGVLSALEKTRHAILVDGVATEELQVGETAEVVFRDDPSRSGAGCPHGFRVRDLLELGRRLGVSMPEKVTTLGIGIRGPFPLSEGLSERLSERFDEIVDRIADFVFSEDGED